MEPAALAPAAREPVAREVRAAELREPVTQAESGALRGVLGQIDRISARKLFLVLALSALKGDFWVIWATGEFLGSPSRCGRL